jgi:tetratricopeptide (TPR) repeat protein
MEARDQGLLHQALEHLDAALQVAREIDDRELVQRATCNRSALAISLGETVESTTELRRILMENGSLEVCFLAAYNLARCHELIKESKKSLFYARIARDRAADLGRSEWTYGALNQIANALAAESHFGEAADRYRDALALLPPGDPITNLEARINLGYCLLMQGFQAPGLTTLYRGLRDARRYARPRLEMIVRIDLAYGTLESGRPDLALRHVKRGLALAERAGDRDAIKNALYIEGEVWSDLARDDEAHQVRADLQRRFYPNQPEIARYLLAVNSRELINLRA